MKGLKRNVISAVVLATVTCVGIVVLQTARTVESDANLWSKFSNEVPMETLESAALRSYLVLNGLPEDDKSFRVTLKRNAATGDERLEILDDREKQIEAWFHLGRMPITFTTNAKGLWLREAAGFPAREEPVPPFDEGKVRQLAEERIRRLVPLSHEVIAVSSSKDMRLAGSYRAEFMVGQNGKGFVDRAGYSIVWFDPYGRVLEFWQGGPYPRVSVPAPKLSEDQALQTALSLIGETDQEKLVIADGYYELKDGSYTLMTLVARRPKMFIDEPSYRLYYAGNERGRVMVDRVSGEARVVTGEERSPFLERTDRDEPRR